MIGGVKNLKRENLRRTLAWAILEELGPTHAKTIPNIERYVIPKRTKYRINKKEKITMADTLMALLILQHVSMQKSIYWMFGVGDDCRDTRQKEFMCAVLPVE